MLGKSSCFFNLKLLANFKLRISLESSLLITEKSLPYVKDKPLSIVLLVESLSKLKILLTSNLSSLFLISLVLLLGLNLRAIFGVKILLFFQYF